MKRLLVSLLALSAAAGLVIASCSPAAPAAPTQPPVAPTKLPEPTKPAAPAPTSVPTALPAKTTDFPAKGKTVSLIVAYPAGGDVDVGARLIAPLLEKEFGIPVQVVNKAGAGGQVGITEIAQAKPDGYTFGYTPIPSGITMYLDPERKAVFTRKSFVPLTTHVIEPDIVAVKADSPYKTLKDLVDAAKANPEKIAVGFTGLLSHQHLAILQLQKLTGAKFAIVSFDGSAPALTALLGDHIQVQVGSSGLFLPHWKSGELRLLAIMDKEESKFLPGVKTAESQGFPVQMATARILSLPAGTPKEIVDIYSAALKKVMASEEHRQKMDQAGLTLRYMEPAQTEAYWAEMEEQIRPLMELANQK